MGRAGGALVTGSVHTGAPPLFVRQEPSPCRTFQVIAAYVDPMCWERLARWLPNELHPRNSFVRTHGKQWRIVRMPTVTLADVEAVHGRREP